MPNTLSPIVDDQSLLEMYDKAVSLQVDQEFIQILSNEIKKRKLKISEEELPIK